MPNDIDRNASAQRRTSKLLTAMGIFVGLGIIAYIILTLLVNRSVPANPDTRYTGTNGISVYYDSSIWSVCQMTEDDTLGTVLEVATADTSDGEDYEAVLLQRGTADSYADFIDASEKDLKQAYGVIKPRKVNLTVDGAEVEAETAECIVAKNRHGETSTVPLGWDGAHTRFMDVDFKR